MVAVVFVVGPAVVVFVAGCSAAAAVALGLLRTCSNFRLDDLTHAGRPASLGKRKIKGPYEALNKTLKALNKALKGLIRPLRASQGPYEGT